MSNVFETVYSKELQKLENRIELFVELITELEGWEIAGVAEESGVHYTTIYNWLGGKTNTPRLDTFYKVANTIGFDLKLVRRKAALKAVA